MSMEPGGKPWAREHLRGIENLLLPSFSSDLRRLDEAGVRLDVRRSIRHGAFSMACVLESGLSPDEQKRFVSIACDEARAGIGVSVTLGAAQPAQIVELLAWAAAAGATHAHLGCPQGFTPSNDEQLIEYVARIAKATRLPLCLVADRFAFPNLHPSGLPLQAIERIADIERVVALQLDTMDAGLLEEACERFGERLVISSPHPGLWPILVRSFGMQWSGPWAMEAVQSPAKRHAVEFFENLVSGEFAEAMRRYWAIAPAVGASARVAATFAHTGARHLPLIKYQQWLSGGNGGLTRQPVMRLYQRDMQVIRTALSAVGVVCGEPDSAYFVGRGGIEGST
ncbi:MAG TPA: dihydrodipicolinate synthase family protein [Steroidobacteraceae bacterium]